MHVDTAYCVLRGSCNIPAERISIMKKMSALARTYKLAYLPSHPPMIQALHSISGTDFLALFIEHLTLICQEAPKRHLLHFLLLWR